MKNQSLGNTSENVIIYLIAAGLILAIMTIAYMGWQG